MQNIQNTTYLLACDHAGLKVKHFAMKYLDSLHIKNIDVCPIDENQKVDYPDIANALCKKMIEIKNTKGILICGSGIGVSIAANRFSHIRAALCCNSYMAQMARAHNDANVLCIGERVSGFGLIEHILHSFIHTKFEGDRHCIRVDKLSNSCKE